MKKLITLCFVFIAKFAISLPTLALPNLSYAEGVEKVTINNADVHGAVINSGKFKVVEVPHNLNLAAINTSTIGVADNKESDEIQDGFSYILIGEVTSAQFSTAYYKLPSSTNQTGTKTLSLTVSYKLIRLKDKASVAAFTVYASGSQSIIMGANQTEITANLPMILSETSKDLASKVMEQLNDQLSKTKQNIF